MTNSLDDLLDPKSGSTEFFTKNTSNSYEFYLSGELLEPENYTSWFDIIRNARTYDSIKLYINSFGGNLYTAIQFLRVMGESAGHITTSVEGACMSAATMVFLSGHSYEITPHSLFMFHNYSAGVFGKGGEMYDQLQFERAWSEQFLTEVYKDFLTDTEIQAMLNNKDIWMTSEQVLERINKLVESRKEKLPDLSTNAS
jgi:ATP-dependent protease ClpP protease subunit